MKKNSFPKLVVMVGLSGSGKSSVAKDYSKQYDAIIVSSDEIRGELFGDENCQDHPELVFKEFHKRIRNALQSGRSVVADATNLTMKERRAVLSNVNKLSCEKIAVVMTKSVEDCMIDNDKRERVVPHDVIWKQACRFQVPFKEEGFDKIELFYSKKCIAVKSLSELFSDMCDFDQRNPHHNETLGEHCNRAADMFNEPFRSAGYRIGSRFHDIGKLFTQSTDENGICHYYGHDNFGAYFLLSRADELRQVYHLNESEVLDAVFLTNYHMKPYSWESEKAHEKYKRIFGEEKYNILMDFHACDKIRAENKELSYASDDMLEFCE